MTAAHLIKSKHTGVPGWESEPEQDTLLKYAHKVPPYGTIFEIGAEFGMSASLFCKGTPRSVEIYSLDLFPDDLMNAHLKNLNDAGYLGRTMPLKGDSRQFWQEWTAPIDLLFIDGDHSYVGALLDIRNWTPFVVAGGFVLIHDCACATNENPHPLHHEVSKAVEETLGNSPLWTLVETVDSVMVFRKAEEV